MKRGPKPSLEEDKAPSKGAITQLKNAAAQLITASDVPVMPEYLLAECYAPAREVWDEEIARIVAGRVGELDSSLVARYCIQEAYFRRQTEAAFRGTVEMPSIASIEALRRTAEALRIGGPHSRVAAKANGQTINNPFANNGNRSRS